MPETGSTEEFAVVEREQTSTSSDATAPVAKAGSHATRPLPRDAEVHPSRRERRPASDMTASSTA